MFEFLAEPDPFDIHTVINLNSDEVADKSVNVFQTQVIGESLIQGMTLDYKFTKKEMCITIKINASLNIGDIVVKVDPQLFFQRIFVFIQQEEINDAFSYELCTRPSSLFEKKSLMNEAHKPALKVLYSISQDSLSVLYLISIKIPIMFLMGAHGCKDFHGLLETCLMKYVNPSKTTC